LDVGGSSGYHGWRMAGAGADTVIIIDPSCLFYHQFMAIRHFVGAADASDTGRYRTHYIPVPLEALPEHSQLFDTVFSMGVLYHRQSPFEHLQQLKGQLVKGGELVLETLVIEGDANTVLVPHDRYAQMNNVYFLPSVAALIGWLEKAGFSDVRCADVAVTSTKEQRQTEWMTYHSLADFLDPNDFTKTVEGYPAPMRATLIAKK
jgi:tRNA (mo5U34)-methyltransferase